MTTMTIRSALIILFCAAVFSAHEAPIPPTCLPPCNYTVCSNSKCYSNIEAIFTRDQARMNCTAMGGRLVGIESAPTFNLVARSFPNKVAWIDSWQTNNYNNNCIVLFTGNGAIILESCSSLHSAICEFSRPKNCNVASLSRNVNASPRKGRRKHRY